MDLEELKPDVEVWIGIMNRAEKLVIHTLNRRLSKSGFTYTVSDKTGRYEIPTDWCYASEIECIEGIINLWRDMRLNYIVKHGLENLPI